MKFLAVALTGLSLLTVSLSAPAVDDNTIETDDAPVKLTPFQALMGTFNMFDADIKDLTAIVDILNDFVALINSYDRSCVLNKLHIEHADPTVTIEDARPTELFQVAAAMCLCSPNSDEKYISIYKKIAPLVKKYTEDFIKPDYVECARQLLVELDPESPLLAEKTSYGACDEDLNELVQGYSSEVGPLLNKINNEISEDCAYFDDTENLKATIVKFALILFADIPEEVKFEEIRRLRKEDHDRDERFLKCTLAH